MVLHTLEGEYIIKEMIIWKMCSWIFFFNASNVPESAEVGVKGRWISKSELNAAYGKI